MTSPTMDYGQLLGAKMIGADGDKIGKIEQLYADREDGTPTFASVDAGLMDRGGHLVPLNEMRQEGETVVVPYSKQQVKDAPNIETDADLSPEEEDRLYAHYGLDRQAYDEAPIAPPVAGTDETTRTAGHDVSGPNTDDAMTVSEERLHVGTEQRESGRARLRKYIVTENVTKTVPVSREEVRVEREPITEANRGAAMSGGDLTEEEHEVILHDERPVVEKETVPTERVRLDTEQVTEQREVGGEVRHEEVDITDPASTTTKR